VSPLFVVICKRNAFRIVFLEPSFGGVDIREDLEVIGVADLLAGVDVDPDRHCQTLTSW
jgi:hypothetical protein